MIYFIALICFALPSYLIRFSVFGIPTTILELLIYIAFIWTIILKIQNPKSQISNKFQNPKFQIPDQFLKPITNNQFLIPILLFLLAGIVSIFVAPDKREALGLFKAYIFDPILFFFVIVINIKDKKDISLILKALIFSGLIVAIHAIWQKTTGQITVDGRVVGIFGFSPNYLALYLTPLAVLAFAYEMIIMGNNHDLVNYKKAWPYDFALFLMLLALYFSGSRAAIGAVVVGIIGFSVFKYWSWIKSRKFVFLFICFLVLLSAIAGWQFIKPNWQLSPSEGGRVTSSNNIRWEIWNTTVKDIIPKDRNWLWGVGLGNYQNYFTALTKDRVNYPEWIAPMALTPHNIFLAIWLNLGVLGLGAFIWLLVVFTRIIFKKNLLVSFALFSVMLAVILQGLVDSPYWKNDLAVMFWVFLALTFVLTKVEKEDVISN